MRPALATLLVLLVLAPTAQAGFFREPLAIELTPLRVGDSLRYETRLLVESAEGRKEEVETLILIVEGKGTRLDRFGTPRDVETLLWQFSTPESRSLQRCHKLAGGLDAVQMEPLDGGSSSGSASWSGLFGVGPLRSFTQQQWEATATFDPGRCLDFTSFTSLTAFREGERSRAGDLAGGMLGPPLSEVLSKPAAEDTFHGRRALRLEFDLREFARVTEPEAAEGMEGTLSFVLAEGLPGFASVGAESSREADGQRVHARFRIDLAGLEAGDGSALAPWSNATLPARHPRASFQAPDPLAFDDSPFAPAYPYAEAFEALRSDPRVTFAAFLRDNPDAALVSAQYDRHEADPVYSPLGTEGSWTLHFAGKKAGYYATTLRTAAAPASLLPDLPPPSPVVRNAGFPTDVGGFTYALPENVADVATLAKIAEAAGIPPAEVALVTYEVAPNAAQPQAILTLADHSPSEGSGEGLVVGLDLATGGLRFLADSKAESGRSLLPLESPSDVSRGGDGRLSAASFLVGPAVGSGLAVTGAAATSLALVVLLLKFVILPLYTRLVRARMLDHPVRAWLVQRARGSPGVRLAELIREALVAESAVRRHLEMLVKHGFLVELREGGAVSYYARGEVPPEAARQSALLRRPSTRQVYELLSREPGLSLREAGKKLGLSAPSVLRHRRMLEKAGLLTRAP